MCFHLPLPVYPLSLTLSNSESTCDSLYLVSQYFENKPVEHLLGEGISADMLNDDCLGRTLDWLNAHDVTTLFAGLALQARRRFGIQAQHLHIDTTSFSVSGDYATKDEGDPVPLAITYGYSRDHREDLKHWVCATRSRRNVCLSKKRQ